MSYSIDPLREDCYENSSVLINKFNLRDERQLDIMERSITSALIAKASFDIPFENVDFEFYKGLHRYVFSDIYEWAGNIRQVEMSKKRNSFLPCEQNRGARKRYIHTAETIAIFKRL